MMTAYELGYSSGVAMVKTAGFQQRPSPQSAYRGPTRAAAMMSRVKPMRPPEQRVALPTWDQYRDTLTSTNRFTGGMTPLTRIASDYDDLPTGEVYGRIRDTYPRQVEFANEANPGALAGFQPGGSHKLYPDHFNHYLTGLPWEPRDSGAAALASDLVRKKRSGRSLDEARTGVNNLIRQGLGESRYPSWQRRSAEAMDAYDRVQGGTSAGTNALERLWNLLSQNTTAPEQPSYRI